jgi:subfamily B ATP-binding cassette protein MsbA
MRQTYANDPTPIDQLKKVNAGSLRRLLSLAMPYRGPLILAALLAFVGTGVQLALPVLARTTIDQALAKHDVGELDRMAVIILALIAAGAAAGYVQFILVANAGNRIVMDTRLRLFERLERMPVAFFDRRRSGDLTSHLSNDVSLLQAALTSDLVQLGGNVVTLFGGIALAVILNWQLTIVVLALLVVVMAFFVVFGRALKKLTRAGLDVLSEAMGTMTEALSNVRLVKAFAREEYETSRADRLLQEHLKLARKASRWEGAMGVVAAGGFVMMLVGVLWFGGRAMLTGAITGGSLVAFLIAVVVLSGPMAQLASLNTRLQRASGAAERIFELLEEPLEPADRPDAVEFPTAGAGDVLFDGVTFSYVAGIPVLQDFSLTLTAGKATALVGPSGAGKSTVASLLYRFYEVEKGEIRLGGLSLSSIRRQSLREHVGLVPQDTYLFNGTIAENIRYGRLTASDAEVEAAARAANVMEFAERFPHGLATAIGERGVTLSGGQRQRVAIARVLLKDPQILVLDEATSSLDTVSEALVKEALERLMAGRTTLVIAHRLSTVQNADQIAVLDRGQVVELGTHAQLLARGGRYAELYQAMASGISEGEVPAER